MKNIKNIIFDLGNVLVDIDYAQTFRALRILLHESNEKEVQSIASKYEVGDISTPLFINAFLRFAGSHVHALDIITAWNAMLVRIPEANISLLQQLSTQYQLYILSNTNSLHIDWVDNYLSKHYDISSFDELVTIAFYSHKMHLRKPDPKIYECVIKKAQINKEETLFIDDMLENISAAHNCGLQTIHLKRPEDLHTLFPLSRKF